MKATSRRAKLDQAWGLDPRDDEQWDREILGSAYPTFYQWLQGTVDLRKLPEVPLTPLQQILLANAAKRGKILYAGSLPRRRRNPLLLAALHRLLGDAQLPLGIQLDRRDLAWFPLSEFRLGRMSGEFADDVSRLIERLDLVDGLSPFRREYLNSLLFHPLQNAGRHGVARYELSTGYFAGASARVVEAPDPITPLIVEYQRFVATELEIANPRLLEVVVHDDGPGIAMHYRRARSSQPVPPVASWDPYAEWVWLNGAFERHATSKPRTRPHIPSASPGVGLVAMLESLQQLSAMMELRTGRLRVVTWFGRSELLPDQFVLKLRGIPRPGVSLAGTTYRFLVPLVQSPRADAV